VFVEVGRTSRIEAKFTCHRSLLSAFPEVIVKSLFHESKAYMTIEVLIGALVLTARKAIFVVRPCRSNQPHIQASRKADADNS